jgi:putative peptidoglycan lipid II flippase
MSADESGAGSTKRSITIASAIMMSSVFLSRILGIVREMVLASYGGTRSEMDAYVASFLLPEIVNHLLAGGFMSVTFIPIFQRHVAENRRDLAWGAFSNLLTTGSVVLAVVIGLGLVFTEDLLGLMGRQIADPQQLALATRMTRIILPAQIFYYWGALLLAVQYAEKQFLIPALAPLLYNAGIIFGGIALGPFIGIEGFAWGVLIGAFVGNFAIQAWGARSCGMTWSWRMDLRDPDLRTYVLVTLPLVIGLGMQFSNEIFFRVFGSFLSPGGLASLNYSLRTMMALVAVFGQAFGVAAFPYLSQYVAQKRYGEMNALLFSMISKVAMVMIPFSLLMMVLSRETLTVLFQRGRFTLDSTLATAPVLSMYCIGAFGIAASNMVSRGFYALQNTVLPMVVSSVAALCSLPFYWLFMQRNGAQGIALVGSLVMLAQFIVLMALWTRQYHGGPEMTRLLVTLSKVLLISAAGCLVCFVITRGLDHLPMVRELGSFLRSLLVLSGGGIPAVALIFLGFDRLGVADLRTTAAQLLRRRSQAAPQAP